MPSVERLSEYLIANGIIKAEQLKEAKQCVSGRKMTLDKALITLGYVDYAQLGQCLSSLCKLPYVPLIANRPLEDVRGLLSVECALLWHIFPYAYDPAESLLTVAISDPGKIRGLEKIILFFMQPYTLVFSVASQAEIDEAIAIHYSADALTDGMGKAGPGGRRTGSVSGEKKRVLVPDSGKAPSPPSPQMPLRDGQLRPKPPARAASSKGADEHSNPGAVQSAGDPDPEFAYSEMRRVLRTAAAVAVRAYLETKGQDRLREICTRVRYCELLSSRLNLPIVQADAVVLGAWLSGLDDRKDLIQQLVSPFKLEEISTCAIRSEGNDRIETRIVSLVKCYQQVSKSDPDIARDMDNMRRLMRREWSSSPVRKGMLEAFLHVLMDEHFLDKVEHTAGKVLIVDPAEGSTSVLTEPLTKCGYVVQVAPTADAAENLLLGPSLPDLIICERDLPRHDGIQFCEKIKSNPKTAVVPLIIISRRSEKEIVAESLRAGAAEFMTKPIDLEVLVLKIRQLVGLADDHDSKSGIKGVLSEMSFAEIVQIANAGRKSMEIVVTSDVGEGRVYVSNGEVTHASVGTLTGEQAFFTMMSWSEGRFSTNRCLAFPDRTIETPTISLLARDSKVADVKNNDPAEKPTPPATAKPA